MENRVRFKIGEIEFEAEGTEEVIERERSVFLNSLLPAAVDAIVKTRSISQIEPECLQSEVDQVEMIECNSVDTSETIRERDVDFLRTNLITFLKKYGVLNDQDFVLMSAYYDERKNDVKIFSSENVKKYYADARRAEYSNISALLRELVKKGLIMDAPDAEQKTPKPYILTSEGLDYVENYQPKLENEIKKSSNRNKKIRTLKIESQYIGLNVDELNIQDYPDIKSIDKFKDQMLIIMYIVINEEKGTKFSIVDIEYLLTGMLGLPATDDQVSGVIKRNKTWFNPEKDTSNPKAYVYTLLEGGKKYAKGLIDANKK